MAQTAKSKTRGTSRISGFYQRSLPDRVAAVAQWAGLDSAEQATLLGMTGLSATQADQMIENVIGVYGLPMGLVTNFQMNTKDYLVPMVVEEPSIVAGCSLAARLIRDGGGFTTSSDDPIMIGQMQLLDIENVYVAAGKVWENRQQLLDAANEAMAAIVKIGGGARDLELRPFTTTAVGPMLVLHLLCDVQDAMGANTINTACEAIAPMIEKMTGGRVNLKIISNLADHRKARAQCTIPAESLKTDDTSGLEVIKAIVEAGTFAEVDPYRATTHNKGIMNGMDAVCIATGNDWRALEAGSHAYAARSGQYRSLTRWWQDGPTLRGEIEVPMQVGTVGGATRVHPTAKVAMKILGVTSARELGEIIASIGLAQNLAAIRALATEGIQRGHMSLHARQFATAAGASGPMVQQVVAMMIAEGNIRLERAREIVDQLKAAQ